MALLLIVLLLVAGALAVIFALAAIGVWLGTSRVCKWLD